MAKSRFYKRLTPAEVGQTKTHEVYIRLANDFDHDEFFNYSTIQNGSVIEVNFTAKVKSQKYPTIPSSDVNLRFVYYVNNANKEKRIPGLGNLFKAYQVAADDVICLESETDSNGTSYTVTFFGNDQINISPSSVFISGSEDLDGSPSINPPFIAKLHSLQQIYFGAPGTGKSHEINKACKAYENYRTTFHPDTDYAGFVGAYKPINTKVPIYDASGHPILEKDENGKEKPVLQPRIEYRYVFQAFLKAYIAAWKEQQSDEPKPVFLVIEEINRGNCAQIFGDIFQLLDRNASGYSDYPIVADDDLAKELKEVLGRLNIVKKDDINRLYDNGKDVMKSVLNGEQLLLPNNLYIWATMNTSDQSLFPIDSAFKRRWDWKYIKIKDHGDQAYKIQFKNGKEYDWWEFIEAINSKIEGGEIQQEDKKLGYFFAKAKEDADGNKLISAETFLSKVIFYLYNDVFKDFGFDEAFFKDENGQVMTFASYFDDEGRPNEARVESFVRNVTNADEKEKIAAEETSTDQPEQEEADTAADENPD